MASYCVPELLPSETVFSLFVHTSTAVVALFSIFLYGLKYGLFYSIFMKSFTCYLRIYSRLLFCIYLPMYYIFLMCLGLNSVQLIEQLMTASQVRPAPAP